MIKRVAQKLVLECKRDHRAERSLVKIIRRESLQVESHFDSQLASVNQKCILEVSFPCTKPSFPM